MENKPGTGISRHALLMILCCAITLALIAAVALFRIDLGIYGYLALLLLCPLMHILMMRGMHGHGDDHACHTDKKEELPAASSQAKAAAETKAAASLER